MMYDFDKHPNPEEELMLELPDDYQEGESLAPPSEWQPSILLSFGLLAFGLAASAIYTAVTVVTDDGPRIIKKRLHS